jgi:hypothetical protein
MPSRPLAVANALPLAVALTSLAAGLACSTYKPNRYDSGGGAGSDTALDTGGTPTPRNRNIVQRGATGTDTDESTDTVVNGYPDDPNGTGTGTSTTTKHWSNGSGGGLGLVEKSYTDTHNLRSSYKINAPQDASATKAYGLHIHLHGDGGGGYKDFPNKETRQDLIGVTVKAPNASLTWGRASGVAHANYLNDLIQNELVKKYNVDLDRIYFSGVSGGSYFLAGHFLPMYGHVYKRGAFLMCGGMAPQVAFVQPEFLKSFRIHWQITAGERDDIKASVDDSVSGWKSALTKAGGDAALETFAAEGDGGHCEFDGQDYTSGIQSMMDLKFATIVTN